MFKNAADLGYKIDFDNFKHSFGNNNSMIEKILNIIPFVNIIKTFIESFNYLSLEDDFFLELKISGCLEELDESENLEYKNNPTSFNAYKINLKSDSKKRAMKRLAKMLSSKTHAGVYAKYDMLEKEDEIDDSKENDIISNDSNEKSIIQKEIDALEEIKNNLLKTKEEKDKTFIKKK
jgi:hypothetical protein